MFLRDTCNGAPSGCTPSTIPISVSSTGSQANAQSFPAIVNTTGRFAAFVSFATNLTPLEAVVPGIFLRDTCAGISSGCSPSTARVDVTASGAQPNQASSATFPAITPDGRLVAFGSTATNFVPTNLCTNAGACSNVYVRDTCTGT